MTAREASTEGKARALTERLGGRWEKLPPTAGVNHRPDRVLLFPRRPPLFIELKRPGEVPTAEQIEALERLRTQGFEATWAAEWLPLKRLIEDRAGPRWGVSHMWGAYPVDTERLSP